MDEVDECAHYSPSAAREHRNCLTHTLAIVQSSTGDVIADRILDPRHCFRTSERCYGSDRRFGASSPRFWKRDVELILSRLGLGISEYFINRLGRVRCAKIHVK